MKYVALTIIAVCALAAFAIYRIIPPATPVPQELAHCQSLLGGATNVGFDLSGDGSNIKILFGARAESAPAKEQVLLEAFLKCVGAVAEDNPGLEVSVQSQSSDSSLFSSSPFPVSGKCEANERWPWNSSLDQVYHFRDAELDIGVGWIFVGVVAVDSSGWVSQTVALSGNHSSSSELPAPEDLVGRIVSPIKDVFVVGAPSFVMNDVSFRFPFDREAKFCIRRIELIDDSLNRGKAVWAGVSRSLEG